MAQLYLIPSLKLTANAPEPENRPFTPKGNEKVFQTSIFRGELLVSGRVHFLESLKLAFLGISHLHWCFGKRLPVVWEFWVLVFI